MWPRCGSASRGASSEQSEHDAQSDQLRATDNQLTGLQQERDALHHCQTANGMIVTSSSRGETDDSVYIWTRKFLSEEHRAEAAEIEKGGQHADGI